MVLVHCVRRSGGVTALSWQREIANNLKVSLMTHLMRNVKDLPVLSTMRIDSLQEIKGKIEGSREELAGGHHLSHALPFPAPAGSWKANL